MTIKDGTVVVTIAQLCAKDAMLPRKSHYFPRHKIVPGRYRPMNSLPNSVSIFSEYSMLSLLGVVCHLHKPIKCRSRIRLAVEPHPPCSQDNPLCSQDQVRLAVKVRVCCAVKSKHTVWSSPLRLRESLHRLQDRATREPAACFPNIFCALFPLKP
jgi:hypothetical protein